MASPKQPEVVCRPIEDADLEAVVACLQRGFPERPRRFWEDALARMARRSQVDDYPRYGHALVVDGQVVGVLLQIFSRRDSAEGGAVRCNLSSWCVDKEHRGLSATLHLTSVRRKEVTYVNISPATHTHKTIEAFGFRRFSEGQIFSLPILSPPRSDVRVVAFDASSPEAALLSPTERQILAEHAAMGCLALVCLEDGLAHPFVFQTRRFLRRLLPCCQLIFCRDIGDFLFFAHAIGRRLMLRCGPVCVVDAMAPLPGLIGWFAIGRVPPKYFKGPHPPSPGDLAYTELVLLGP